MRSETPAPSSDTSGTEITHRGPRLAICRVCETVPEVGKSWHGREGYLWSVRCRTCWSRRISIETHLVGTRAEAVSIWNSHRSPEKTPERGGEAS